ncbi:MAG: RluA family pseudouridine synthase [Chloroflexota bacterium]
MSDEDQVFNFNQDEKQRLDHFLAANMPNNSRTFVQGLIKEGHVKVNGKVVLKAGQKLEHQQEVRIHIPPPAPSNLIPENIKLDIIFENQDVLLINKPAGMVVHPSAGHETGTLVHAVLAHASDLSGIGGEKRPGVVHRLDKQTSGVIIMAKNDQAHQFLQAQFKDRKVEKYYMALVEGAPPTPKGRVEAPIGRDSTHRQKMAVVQPNKGRDAISLYETLEVYDKHTLLSVKILTGRTHQIRVHMAFLNCPIVGDSVYGYRHPSIGAKRQLLHARKISIQLPNEKEPSTFEAELPLDMSEIINNLKS